MYHYTQLKHFCLLYCANTYSVTITTKSLDISPDLMNISVFKVRDQHTRYHFSFHLLSQVGNQSPFSCYILGSVICGISSPSVDG